MTTRSPFLTRLTPGPTSTISPMFSWPAFQFVSPWVWVKVVPVRTYQNIILLERLFVPDTCVNRYHKWQQWSLWPTPHRDVIALEEAYSQWWPWKALCGANQQLTLDSYIWYEVPWYTTAFMVSVCDIMEYYNLTVVTRSGRCFWCLKTLQSSNIYLGGCYFKYHLRKSQESGWPRLEGYEYPSPLNNDSSSVNATQHRSPLSHFSRDSTPRYHDIVGKTQVARPKPSMEFWWRPFLRYIRVLSGGISASMKLYFVYF